MSKPTSAFQSFVLRENPTNDPVAGIYRADLTETSCLTVTDVKQLHVCAERVQTSMND